MVDVLGILLLLLLVLVIVVVIVVVRVGCLKFEVSTPHDIRHTHRHKDTLTPGKTPLKEL